MKSLYRKARPDELTAKGRAAVIRHVADLYEATIAPVATKRLHFDEKAARAGIASLEKTRRGPKPTGVTPGKLRSAKSKAELLKAGGRRLTVNLGPEATAALAEIRERTPAASDRMGIEYALQAYAVILAKGKRR